MKTKYVVRAYGSDHTFETRQAAEVFAESNACAVDRVDGQWVREFQLPLSKLSVEIVAMWAGFEAQFRYEIFAGNGASIERSRKWYRNYAAAERAVDRRIAELEAA